MQRLNEKWLKLVNYYIVATTAIYFCLHTYFMLEQRTFFVTGKDYFGVSLYAYILAIIVLVYGLGFIRIVRKSNIFIAYGISLAAYAILNSSLVETALHASSFIFFLANNFIILFMATTLGLVVTFFTLAVIFIIYGMTLSGTTSPSQIGLIGDSISVILRAVMALLLLYFFRNHYETEGVNDDNYIERYFVDNEVVKLLTDSISDGIIILDNEGFIKSVNPGACAVADKFAGDMVSRQYDEVLNLRLSEDQDLDYSSNPINQVLNGIGSFGKELVLVNSSHDFMYVDVNASTIANRQTGAIYGAVVIIRDISKKKREEDAKSEFISTASHEMRTPVAAIEGFLTLAMNPSVGNIDDKTRDFLEKAYDNTQHLSRLFHDLLLSSNAEDGQLINKVEVVDMIDLMNSQVNNMAMMAQDKGLELKFVVSQDIGMPSADSSPSYKAKVDPDRIKEVIANIISNAIKYTESGGVEAGLTGDSSILQFYIKDTGVGIAQSDIEFIFDKFYRVDDHLHRSTNGTGLGLFICKKIIEMYDGRIWVESKKGIGTTFFVNIPRYFGDDSKEELN